MATKKSSNKLTVTQQRCPCCSRFVKSSSIYSNYICDKCSFLAVDKKGEKIIFAYITLDGRGIQGVYTISGKLYRTTFCFIKGIKCRAYEHKLGGIVILPLSAFNKHHN